MVYLVRIQTVSQCVLCQTEAHFQPSYVARMKWSENRETHTNLGSYHNICSPHGMPPFLWHLLDSKTAGQGGETLVSIAEPETFHGSMVHLPPQQLFAVVVGEIAFSQGRIASE